MMEKTASEKKNPQKFTYALSLGPNENLLQAVTIEAKAVLLNGSLSHKFLTSLFSKSEEVQVELLLQASTPK